MSGRSRTTKKIRKTLGREWETARGNLEDLGRATEPHRKWIAQEARRQSPRLAAFLLATLLEMRRGSRRPESPRRPKRRRGVRLVLLLAVLAAGVALLRRRR